MAIERLLTGSIKDQIKELMSTEDLVIEAFRDLVKDELKTHIKNKVDSDPDLKEEIKEAVAYYFHSKARSIYAELRQPGQQLGWDSDYYPMICKVKLARL